MSTATLENIREQLEQLAPEEKWTLLSLLIESLRRQSRSTRGKLVDYYGAGKGRGFQSASAADAFIEKERSAWER
jgi:hypothetical protein